MAINTQTAGPVYSDAVVRQFALAAVLWGIVGQKPLTLLPLLSLKLFLK